MTDPPLYPDTFTYDGFGQMTSSYVNGVTTTYAYRADGLRKSKTANGVITRHVWDGDQIVQDRTGWYTTTEYVRGIRLIDTFTYGDYARFTYIQNARGDVVGFVDGLTSIADTVDYDGFGTYESYTPTNPLGYCGEYRDAETGFIYLRARYYDPNLGRFTTEDPARDGLNWYVYCNNNPVNFVDPSGLDAIIITADHAASGMGHTSILTQDTRDGKWYYFYWGDKATYFVEVPWEDGAMSSLDSFNSWLNNQDLPYSTKNYTSATFVEGDFNASVDYFKELVSNTTIESGYMLKAGRYAKCVAIKLPSLKQSHLGTYIFW